MTFVTQIIVFCFYFHFTQCAIFLNLILGGGIGCIYMKILVKTCDIIR